MSEGLWTPKNNNIAVGIIHFVGTYFYLQLCCVSTTIWQHINLQQWWFIHPHFGRSHLQLCCALTTICQRIDL
ncbi:hypothetical protein V6Z11_A10G168500 [Gossypium hirsutum]